MWTCRSVQVLGECWCMERRARSCPVREAHLQWGWGAGAYTDGAWLGVRPRGEAAGLQRLCSKERMAGESGGSAGRRQACGVERGSAGVHAVVRRKGKCAARWEGEVEMPVRLAVRSSDGRGGWAGRAPSQGRCTVRDSFWIAQSLLAGGGSAGCPCPSPDGSWTLQGRRLPHRPSSEQQEEGGADLTLLSAEPGHAAQTGVWPGWWRAGRKGLR